MSNQIAKNTVKIKENDLVSLIESIVEETVAVEKKQWIAEQAKKAADKTAILESRLAILEKALLKK